MGTVYVTMKIMPKSPDTDLESVEGKANDVIINFGGSLAGSEQQPIAFGLMSLNITFSMSEDGGNTEDLEKQLTEIEDVMSAQVTDMRRAIG